MNEGPKIRVAIVDDEPLARRRIRKLLARDSDVETVCDCADGYEAVEAIGEHAPDLVFLDVQMPEVDGFGVLERLDAERLPFVIFVTAYDQYALRAFEVSAVDYLLKPFDRKRFTQALQRAKARLATERRRLNLNKNRNLTSPWKKSRKSTATTRTNRKL